MAIYSLSHSSVSRSTHRAGTAGAHARYIMRRSAASAVLGEHMPTGRRSASTWLDRQEASDRKNARVIDKLMVALPRELVTGEHLELVRRFLRRIGLDRVPWLVAIHDQGEDAHNPHAHILIRDRDIETGRRVAQLSEKGSTRKLRKFWEEETNLALEKAGQTVRIDCRSLRDQGIDRQPRRHQGPKCRSRKPSHPLPSSFPLPI